MTATEKQQLYNHLSLIESGLRGWPVSGETPHFTDDGALGADTQTEEGQSAHTEARGPTLESIAEKISHCSRCQLAQRRTRTVPGFGVEKPLVLVIGEGPGAEEDAQGKPFVGKAGQLLDKMLAAISLSRHTNCFITNVVKCRPPANRDPQAEETAACASFLEAQIQLLKPKIVLAVGRIAAQQLLQTTEGIGRLRGRFTEYRGIPFMATYHPSALLRDETLKRPAWEDLKSFRDRLLELCGGEYAS